MVFIWQHVNLDHACSHFLIVIKNNGANAKRISIKIYCEVYYLIPFNGCLLHQLWVRVQFMQPAWFQVITGRASYPYPIYRVKVLDNFLDFKCKTSLIYIKNVLGRVVELQFLSYRNKSIEITYFFSLYIPYVLDFLHHVLISHITMKCRGR